MLHKKVVKQKITEAIRLPSASHNLQVPWLKHIKSILRDNDHVGILNVPQDDNQIMYTKHFEHIPSAIR